MQLEASASVGGRHWLRSSDGSYAAQPLLQARQQPTMKYNITSPNRSFFPKLFFVFFTVTSWLASDMMGDRRVK